MDTLVKAVVSALAAKVPVLLWGPPGTGKTATLNEIAKKLGWHMYTLVGATRSAHEIGGWPVVVNGKVTVQPFPWMEELFAAGEKAILFLDELTSSGEEIRRALLRILGEGYLGDFKYHGRIVAAANPEEHAVGGSALEAPIANRLLHLDWSVDVTTWAKGMMTGFSSVFELPPLPSEERLKAETAAARALVASYVMRNPGTINKVPEDERAGRAWPSYRSWDLAARLLGAAWALDFDDEVIALLVLGTVGPEGRGFLRFLAEEDLPTPKEVLDDPNKLPKREDALFASLMAMVSHLASPDNWERENWEKAWRVLSHLVSRGKGDVALWAAKRIIALHKEKGNPFPYPEAIDAFAPILEEVRSYRVR